MTITQWWPDAWWADIVNPDLDADNHVWRAWTTEHCLNFIEIPIEGYAAAQKVTRSVYQDELDCTHFWKEVARDGTAAVEEEIARGLTHLFSDNGLTAPAKVTIPKPLKTYVQVWPAAWHGRRGLQRAALGLERRRLQVLHQSAQHPLRDAAARAVRASAISPG